MGIVTNNNYLKLNMNNTYIDSQGVHIAYSMYDNKDTRDEEKKFTREFELFETNLSNERRKINAEFENYAKVHNIDTQNPPEKIPSDLQELINKYSSISNDYNTILQYIGNGDIDAKEFESKITNLNLMISLGFNVEWVTKRTSPSINITKISGPYLKQDFTYKSMYNELKKTLKGQKYEDV